MGKMKKKLKKKVNPGRSNKMIIAVAIGVVIVFVVLFWLMIGSSPDTPVNKEEVMNSVLKYLEKGEGILQLKKFPDRNKFIIVYDSYIEKKDFLKIARYAGMKLSNKMGDEEVTVILSKDKESQEVYICVLKNGRILQESVMGE